VLGIDLGDPGGVALNEVWVRDEVEAQVVAEQVAAIHAHDERVLVDE
jgi:hypothetical protein